jgi:O-antigen/teichoic acid export membrane protein
MIASSIGYVLANNSEIVLVTTILGPVPAAAYALTRRAIDGLRNLLDSIAWAVYGGFAHLVTAGDRHRARPILHEMLWLRLALACLFGAVAVAVNRPFVTLLFGRAQFGGVWLTAALAAQMIAGGQAFLANCLLRAAGAVKQGSWLVAAEAALRVLAMAIGIRLFGLVGAPSLAVIVSMAALFVNLRELSRRLPPPVAQALAGRLEHQFAPLAVFASGLAAGLWLTPMSWTMAVATGTLVGCCGAGLLWCALPSRGAEATSLLRFRWNRS